ncbi:MAG TPA: hypothetical protein VKF82_00465 [Candidatus Eremiobacteraceae bacterium]|nr:hypothetical protein [Candidatus Eremiobacteraceae bacterium]
MTARSLAAAFVLALPAMPAFAAQPVPYLPVPHDAAVILETGSTNSPGYRIVVQRSGEVEYVEGAVRRTAALRENTAGAFFADLQSAMPLSALRAGRCMKSASFGSSTFGWWRGQRSPDLQCAADPRGTALYSSISAIALELGMGQRRIPLMPNEPRRPMPESSPTPSTP